MTTTRKPNSSMSQDTIDRTPGAGRIQPRPTVPGFGLEIGDSVAAEITLGGRPEGKPRDVYVRSDGHFTDHWTVVRVERLLSRPYKVLRSDTGRLSPDGREVLYGNLMAVLADGTEVRDYPRPPDSGSHGGYEANGVWYATIVDDAIALTPAV